MNMTMEHITATVCPDCGCDDVKRFEKTNRHENGQWNERLTFACGLVLHYSPAMYDPPRTESESDCCKSPRALEWKAQRTTIINAMVQAAKDAAGMPDADLDLLAMSLRSDLNHYRDELEQDKPQERA
jgi:hypothetical protein